ncbi:Calcyclin-binding protein [Pseudolycoriella hygida]|uniref:Calcyclin-binding protein n=1 Tax=Pseudolycoriella hygida TaxID=35572 RepID=A0A9Q0MQE8_9DIPT|nr:Calcyclin-binding protein [Pseudolycoriella hygida]
MASAKLDELTKDLEELKQFSEKSLRKRVQGVLDVEIRKIETEIIQIRDQIASTSDAVSASVLQKPTSNLTKRYEVELTNYGWDQSGKFIKLFVTLDGLSTAREEDVIVSFSPSSIVLEIKGVCNKDYRLNINNLLESIDEERSYRKLKTNMVTIYAKKVKEGSHWSHLTTIEKRLKAAKEDLLKDSADDDVDSKDPSAGLMNIMKKMYQTGDAETKRMISKAWTEGAEKKAEMGM